MAHGKLGKKGHRSHFGSRYKLGCCGHAGLFGHGFDSFRPNAHTMVASAGKLRKPHTVTNTTRHTRLPNDEDLATPGNN